MTELSRELRQVLVRHLADAGKNASEIAAELGISRHTARRDLEKTPDTAPAPAAPDEPDGERLVSTGARPGPEGLNLPPSEQLGKDLRLIAVSHKRPAEAVAAELLHAHAEAIRARARARFATART